MWLFWVSLIVYVILRPKEHIKETFATRTQRSDLKPLPVTYIYPSRARPFHEVVPETKKEEEPIRPSTPEISWDEWIANNRTLSHMQNRLRSTS